MTLQKNLQLMDESLFSERNSLSIYLSYLHKKTDKLSQPKATHNLPEFFGLTAKQVKEIRLENIEHLISKLEQHQAAFNKHVFNEKGPNRDYAMAESSELEYRIYKLKRKMAFIKAPASVGQSFDLDQIKQYPIGDLVEVNKQGYFKLRDENTPSCHWYKKNNTWWDFGDQSGGSVIDLVMKLRDCSFIDACRYLGA